MYSTAVLAVVASTLLSAGLYFMKRQAERLPSLDGGWRLRAWKAFVRDPWWVLGVGLQTAGFGLYLVALRGAALSIVHTALNGGIALFVLFAVLGLGERVRTAEWIGIGAVLVGLVALGLSLTGEARAATAARGAVPFAVAVSLSAGLAVALDRAPGRAVGLSVASGLILGLSGIYAKVLSASDSLTTALTSGALLLTLLTNIAGFALMQGALQAGRGVVAVPILSTLSNIVPVVGGMVVFGEGLPHTGLGALLRSTSFVLAIGGAGVLAACGEVGAPANASTRRHGEGRPPRARA